MHRSSAVGGLCPLKHVVVVVMENHTFDNYFGRDRGRDCCPAATLGCLPTHARALRGPACACRYGPHEVAVARALARQYALGSRYFSEVAGPSDPNHWMLMCAQSPLVRNRFPWEPWPDMTSIADRLEAAGLQWRNYRGRPRGGLAMLPHLRASTRQRPWQDFLRDARRGDLPHLSWVTPPFARSDHPPAPPWWGGGWLAEVLCALGAGPAWRHTAAFVVWDHARRRAEGQGPPRSPRRRQVPLAARTPSPGPPVVWGV